MFNNWAVKKWSMALDQEFSLDTATFIICSLIPLSYIEVIGGENKVVVNMSDIEGLTRMAKEGCELLIDKKFATWGYKYKVAEYGEEVIYTPTEIDYTKLVIGTSKNYTRCNYFFEDIKAEKVALKNTLKIQVPKEEEKEEALAETDTLPELSSLYDWLDLWFEKYKSYCEKIRLVGKPSKIEAKIKLILEKVKNNKKLIHTDLLTYLDCINAMVCEWTDVPDRYTDIKLRQMATKVLSMTTPENILKVVPYFVEHYPKWAKSGYESTNIYMLSFHINSCLTKMNGLNAKQQKNYADDSL